MVICEEIMSGSNIEAKGKGAISSSSSMAKQWWPKESCSVFLQRKHSLSVTFLRDFQGVVLRLYQAPEITRSNFVTYLPTGSQLRLSLEIPQSSFLHRNYNNSVKMLGWNNNTEPSIRPQIIKTLREMIKRVVVAFRMSTSPLKLNGTDNFNDVVEAVPVSFRPPTSTSLDMIVSPKKRVTTLLVGETLVSFELPPNCPFDLEDLEKLVEVERKEGTAPKPNGENVYNVPQYTFLERFEGWKMERRQRVNGRFDMYYHHLRSRKVFRSIAEVVNFFMYEVSPSDKPQKSATKSKLGEDGISSKKTEKRVTPMKRKIEESKKPREKWQPIYDLNLDIQKAYHDHENNSPNKLYEQQNNVDHQKASNDHHHHIPFFDLNDYDQTADDDDDDDDQEEGYDDDDDDDDKEKVEKFLAESYDNLTNLKPHCATKKSTSLSFDINEEISEEADEQEDGNFNNINLNNDQSADELLAEAYDNLMTYHKNQPNFQKGKEKKTSERSIKKSPTTEKPSRKKVKTFTPISFPSFPYNPPMINMNSIPLAKNNYKQKEKIITDIEVDQPMKEAVVQKAVTSPISNMKHHNKRFNIKEVNGKIVFVDDDCEPSYTAPTTSSTRGGGGSGGGMSSSSPMEVAKSVAFLHMDECDLINHIPESSDMFDLAMFLSNNRGNNGGF